MKIEKLDIIGLNVLTLKASQVQCSYIIEEEKLEKKKQVCFFQNLHDEGTANEDCQMMEQLGASLYKTIGIHNVNEPRYELIVIIRDSQGN